MNTLRLMILSSLILAINMLTQGQSADRIYKIAQWRDFANAAITYTFDDNCSNQYTKAIPLFNEYDFNATFYVVADWDPDWDQFAKAAAKGHEIGSHTISHASMSSISDSLQDAELKNSCENINKHLAAEHCLTMAYPYCVPANQEITAKYYIAARHCQGNIEQSTPSDFFSISSIICGDQGSIKTFEDFETNAYEADSLNGWSVYLMHGIDNDGGYSALSSEVLQQSLDFFNNHRDKFWVATFADVVRYIQERDAAEITETVVDSQSILVEISDTLPDNVYNMPISIARTVPEGWEVIEVHQNGIALNVSKKEIENVPYIVFDAIPDGGLISLKNVSSSKLSENSDI